MRARACVQVRLGVLTLGAAAEAAADGRRDRETHAADRADDEQIEQRTMYGLRIRCQRRAAGKWLAARAIATGYDRRVWVLLESDAPLCAELISSLCTQ